jgi:L-fucose dehydrogenase
MDLGLSGKVVVVTGGGSGIGAAVSEVLAEEGAVPVILARRAPEEAFLSRLAARSARAGFVLADLSRDADCERAASEVRDRWGAIHGLVNNAGSNDKLGLDAGSDALRQSLDRTLVHYVALMRMFLPDLRAAKGAVVNVSSKTALTGQGGTTAYVAAKAAQLGLTREWAADLAGDGVRVNAVVPAEVMTPALPPAPRRRAPTPGPRRRASPRASPWPPLHHPARDRRHGRLPAVGPRGPHHRPVALSDGGYTHLDRALDG